VGLEEVYFMILEVKLSNIKSYESQKIRFYPGVNAIIGENGAGKTTIIEAIGFVLFNTLPYKISDFLRRGEKKGEIRIKIIAKDERTYELVRKISKNGTSEYYVNDLETGRIAEGTSEVLEWIEDNFNLEVDPAIFFENVIGIQQGKMISQFLEAPSARDKIFSPIIGVEGYKKAFEKSKRYESFIKERISEMEKNVAIIKKEVEVKKKLNKKLKTLIEQKKEFEKQLKEMKIDDLKITLENYDKLKSKLETLTVEKSQKESILKTFEPEISRIKTEMKGISKAGKEMKELEEDYKEYLSADKEISQLEPQRTLLEKKFSEMNNIKLNYERLLVEMQITNKTINELKKREEELDDLIKLAKTEKELKEDLHKIENAEVKLSTLTEQIQSLKKDINLKVENLRKSKEIRKTLERMKQRRDKISPLIEKKDVFLSAKASLKAKIEIKEKEYLQVKDNICPILKEKCEKMSEISGTKKEELEKIQSKLKELEEKCSILEEKNKDYKKLEMAISKLEADLRVKDDISQEINGKKEELEKIEKMIAELKEFVERKGTVVDKLDALSGASEKLVRLKGELAQKKALEKKLEDMKKKEGEFSEKISSYKDLEGQIKEIREKIGKMHDIRKRCSESFKRYIQCKEKYSRKDEILEKLNNLKKAKSNLKKDLEKINEKLDEIIEKYDTKKHNKIKSELEALIVKKGELEGKIENISEGIKEIKDDLIVIEGKEAELKKKEDEINLLEKKLRFINTLREVFKMAVPGITKAYVDAVSKEANRVFCEMMDDFGWELYWTEDFGIKARYMGKEIEFIQMSGGEQMCAALSVRLALLKTMSGADIALFDEPTQNMDEVRRRNFASQLPRIEGFEQIIVISHDSTFEEMVENAITVRKDRISVIED